MSEPYDDEKDLRLRIVGLGGVSGRKSYYPELQKKVKELEREISERRAIEAELRGLKAYLYNVIDSMPSVLIAVDPDQVVTQWNLGAEKVSGIKASDAVGKPLSSILPSTGPKLEWIRKALIDKKPVSMKKIPSKTGDETRFEDVTIYPLVANCLDGAVIRIDDVTEQVRLEDIMIQSEKMLSVGGLAAGMAHEINNPLAGILQGVAVLKNRLLSTMPANLKSAEDAGIDMECLLRYMEDRKITDMLSSIQESSERAAYIVKEMLNFARKGRDPVPCDLCSLMDRTLELAGNDYDLKKKYDFRNIVVEKDYDPHIPNVLCEPGQIQQVLLNLMKNGAQAMRESGVSNPKLFLSIKIVDNLARMSVQDNGPGVSEETAKRIFEPFFTTKKVGDGTGLGLSVSYFIVTENHGGSMYIERPEDGGCRFVVEIPLVREG